jgi:hypothetical protein
MTQPPLTDQQLDDIEARTTAAEDGWHVVIDTDTYRHEIHGDGPTHVAVFGGNPDDGFASYPVEANAEFAAHARADVPALLAEVRRLRTRTLTEGEYDAAWHAVEGAAGEEGADPATILHAVLDRLGILRPGTSADGQDDGRQPCGEGHCRCYGTSSAHVDCACGCDCPRDDDGQLLEDA